MGKKNAIFYKLVHFHNQDKLQYNVYCIFQSELQHLSNKPYNLPRVRGRRRGVGGLFRLKSTGSNWTGGSQA